MWKMRFSRNNIPFRGSYLGTPFYISNTIPTLLDACQESESATDKPARGRRLITFTDSRQGTARISVKLQQDSERDCIRGLVYNAVVNKIAKIDESDAKAAADELLSLSKKMKQYAGDKGILDLLEERKSKLESSLDVRSEPIVWMDMVSTVQSSVDVSRFVLDHYRNLDPDLFGTEHGLSTLSELLLLREFARRPKRQNSLETLGLVSLHYPDLVNVKSVPNVWSRYGFDHQDWLDFLKVALDFHIREYTIIDIPRSWTSWMGAKVFPKTILNPRSEEEVTSRVRRWPKVRGKRSNRLARLIAAAAEVSLNDRSHEDAINEILFDAWNCLTGKSQILMQVPDRVEFRLDRGKISFLPCTKAWVCPLTNRFVDVAFKGLSPYLPFEGTASSFRCESYEIPTFNEDVSDCVSDFERRERVRRWLKENRQIQDLRSKGLWSDVSDKVIEGGKFFRTAEHSAQQSAEKLNSYEGLFKLGKINVLNCSTTMEMGVDIGGISVVGMNNVPPHPANYLQRSGRAGRRGETQALSFTICKDNPHERNVFNNPLWPFETSIPAPYISLNSSRIVQRHLNSLFLATFLGEKYSVDDGNLLGMRCEGFFLSDAEGAGKSPYMLFKDWLEALVVGGLGENLKNGIEFVKARSVLAGVSNDQLLVESSENVANVAEHWISHVELLRKELRSIENVSEKDPFKRKIEYDIKRLNDTNLVSELAKRQFLPNYGFPTGVATFNPFSIHQFKGNRVDKKVARRASRNLPSRDMSYALREYAPGADMVLDGMVYKSAGVILNNEFEPNASATLALEWRCGECGNIGNSTSSGFSGKCDICDSSVRQHNTREYVEPFGFAVDFYSNPETDVNYQSYIPVEEPWVTANTDLEGLFNPLLGGCKSSPTGHIFHHSAGLNGNGYAICLRCGRAESMSMDGEVPRSLSPANPHRKLRGKSPTDDNPYCDGSGDAYALKTHVYLGSTNQTDVFELYLKNPTNGEFLRHKKKDKLTWTLAVVLRQSLADLHGVNANEMRYTVKPSEIVGVSKSAAGIVLFDSNSGGAGFASSAPRHMEAMLKGARRYLECDDNCESVCQSCLVGYDTRFHMELLDRHVALEYLDSIKPFFDLPKHAQIFGQGTVFCQSGILGEILDSAKGGFEELKVFLADDVDQWNVGVSSLKTHCISWLRMFKRVSLVIPSKDIIKCSEADRDDIWALSRFGVDIEYRDGEVVKGLEYGVVSAQLVSGKQILTLGTDKVEAAIPNFGYWDFDEAFQLMSRNVPLMKSSILDSDLIRPQRSPTDVDIDIVNQFDGPLRKFGEKVWKKLAGSHGELGERIGKSVSIDKISYSDSFLSSPISLLLFAEVISGLLKANKSTDAKVEIQAGSGFPSQGRLPPNIIRDWNNSSDQKMVFEQYFESAFGIGVVAKIEDRRTLAHHRTLEILWKDGECTRIRFDKGMGAWGIKGSDWPELKKRNTGGDELIKEMIGLRNTLRVGLYNEKYTPVVIKHIT